MSSDSSEMRPCRSNFFKVPMPHQNDPTILFVSQSWTPALRIDWMAIRIYSTGFKGPSAIGSTLA